MTGRRDCDVLVIGGGLAGAGLAIGLARAGLDVVVAEREREFRDRIRGEVLLPWGVAEARRLGLAELLLGKCAHEVPWIVEGEGGQMSEPADARLHGPHRAPSMTFLHPAMQETLLREAASLATVHRRATVGGIEPGERPSATIEVDGGSLEVRPRLIVGADGRNSAVARLAGFERRRDGEELLTAGVLVTSDHVSADQLQSHFDGTGSRLVIIVSPAPGMQRLYLIYRADGPGRRLSGERDFEEFARQVVAVTGADVDGAGSWRQHGPLGSFDGAHRWIPHPARPGVVLVGDAAAASDPAYGCGLARTLRDVRLLRNALVGQDDWSAAGEDYARAHDAMFAELRAAERLVTTVWLRPGSDADATRARASALPDREGGIALNGPEMPREALESCLLDADRRELADSYRL